MNGNPSKRNNTVRLITTNPRVNTLSKLVRGELSAEGSWHCRSTTAKIPTASPTPSTDTALRLLVPTLTLALLFHQFLLDAQPYAFNETTPEQLGEDKATKPEFETEKSAQSETNSERLENKNRLVLIASIDPTAVA